MTVRKSISKKNRNRNRNNSRRKIGSGVNDTVKPDYRSPLSEDWRSEKHITTPPLLPPLALLSAGPLYNLEQLERLQFDFRN